MTEIWLIRHGQTDWNAARRYQGQADIPLNEVGEKQAFTLAEQFAPGSFDAIYSSDLSRAYRTAEILNQRLGLPITTDKRLREICQGVWEGLSLAEVQEKYADDFVRGAKDPAFARAPGGESVAEVSARMTEAAREIHHAHPHGRVLLVSHGLAVSTLYCQANQISLSQVYQYIPDNAVPMKIFWNSAP